jgi:hypothetical protein
MTAMDEQLDWPELADSCGSPLSAIEHPILTVAIQQHPLPRHQFDPARTYPTRATGNPLHDVVNS